ncbi:thioredoxin-disulfide reductase [Caballeronia fortuita]|uniref:Thioredoxin-disulfide reductase n=1 Tax=Caballeronia fortuita TaxID=1777138 RepID=A0A157ZUK0_9BURK|nr:FAD-dependent oxidoreductase [Caballeronia fortuita]SAK49234.1 thioredoxin-disulfide reductase [Caballeronia fortuita]
MSSKADKFMVRIYGCMRSANGYAIRDFLHRCDIPFEWIELGSDKEAKDLAHVQHLSDSRLPVCIFHDGTRLECPTVRQITEKLGWFTTPSREAYDLAIYGAGPAGLSAAVYGASEGLHTVLVERWALGGQAGSSSKIENYLGFPHGVSGAELAERARDQAFKFGAEILIAREGVRAEFPPGQGIVYLEDGTRITARTSICATGVAYRTLGLEGETRFFGAGLYYGAGTSEAALVHGDDVYVVGGGNSAGQAAMHFSQSARRVYMLVRDASLKNTLSQYLVDRIAAAPNIEVRTNTEVTALAGRDTLQEITLTDVHTGQRSSVKTSWLFVCIGGQPKTEWAQEVGVVRDEGGYLVTGPDLQAYRSSLKWPLERAPLHLETSVPGVFAAGDVRHGSIKRVASAVGEGAMAVALVHRYLESA